MANIREVARQAGVSVATVSRVLNHPESVSPSTMKQVLETMKRLDYTPNVFARSLALNRSLHRVDCPQYIIPSTPSCKGVEDIARQAIIYCCVIRGGSGKEAGLSKYVAGKRAGGLVLTSAGWKVTWGSKIRGTLCSRAEYGGGRCQYGIPTTK